jgi:hypothetical protein
VLAAFGEAEWSGLVVDSVECAIDGMVVCVLDDGSVLCALDDALFLIFCLLLELHFVDMFGTVEVNAVAEEMI